MNIGVEEIHRPVYLTAIKAYQDGHYHYEITFSGKTEESDDRHHSYDDYEGFVLVAENSVNARIQDLFRRRGIVYIDKTETTRGEAMLGKLLDIRFYNDQEYYIRQLQVTHGRSDHRYRGKCLIPCKEETPTRWRYEEAFAVRSIEAMPIESEPKRTVVILGVPHPGKKVLTEVWSLDGQISYRGSAHVHSVDHHMEDDVQKVYLTIRAPIAHRYLIWLKGDYVENGSNRAGPFVQIDEPEEE